MFLKKGVICDMEYDEKWLVVISILTILGVVLILAGIITSEIEINKYKYGELYDRGNSNR